MHDTNGPQSEVNDTKLPCSLEVSNIYKQTCSLHYRPAPIQTPVGRWVVETINKRTIHRIGLNRTGRGGVEMFDPLL